MALLVEQAMGGVKLDVAVPASKEEQLNQLRGRKIESVLTRGLIPGSALQEDGLPYLSCADEEPVYEVLGNELHPGFSQEGIEWLLYFDCNGVFRVVTERATNEMYPKTSQTASVRSQASLLIISKVEELKQAYPGYVEFYSDLKGTGFPCTVDPQYFLHIVAPRDVWQSNHNRLLRPGTQLTIIDNTVKRNLYYENSLPFTAPDYESVMQELAQTTQDALWVHAVRLPTIGDL